MGPTDVVREFECRGHNQVMPPPLTSLILYVSDLDESLRFYTALGLDFLEDDRCEESPRRFSALLEGDAVLELRTCGDGPPTRTRLGFALPDPSSVGERVGALRYSVINRPGMLVTARDPDGNTVELTLASA
jgi:catechol 2,3-dioxygenase-like lactoylglutathione lyase family enzyme